MTTARRPRRRARGLAALLATALALTLGACGGDDEPDEETSTTTSSTESPPTTAAPSPEDEVEAAYLAYWDMAARLSADPNPDDPEIAQRAVDPALSTMVDTLSTLRAQGEEVHPGPQYRRVVTDVQLDRDTATLRDCTVDDSARLVAASGETIGENLSTLLVEATLLRSSGAWLVSEIEVIERWDGVQECTG